MSESTPTHPEVVEDEVKPRSKPEGSPDLIPFKAVPRRRRAELMRKFGVIQEREKALQSLQEASSSGSLQVADAAEVYEFMADVEDMLAEAAHDGEAFRDWCATAEDAELMRLLGWYVTTFQVGEA